VRLRDAQFFAGHFQILRYFSLVPIPVELRMSQQGSTSPQLIDCSIEFR
jgi:hypothetical protein